jgi:hypothetical protein
MNADHENLCASPEWAGYLQTEILPAVTAGIDLGKDVLEIGPGPGAATGWLAETLRVLRPGGTLAGSDSLASVSLHHFHAGDAYNPLDPATLLTWLRALGFSPVTITVGKELMFTARKPAAEDDHS